MTEQELRKENAYLRAHADGLRNEVEHLHKLLERERLAHRATFDELLAYRVHAILRRGDG